jgi:rRNA-processing protein FCF1
MNAVIDSSTLISLARTGLLPLLAQTPLVPIVLDVVWRETVDAGLAGSHPDLAAIETTISRLPVRPTPPSSAPVDAAVLAATREIGILVTNDLALGRRARNIGQRWLRTTDLIALAIDAGTLSAGEGRRAILALLDAGRITSELANAYLEEFN